jgi:hypothetical protein
MRVAAYGLHATGAADRPWSGVQGELQQEQNATQIAAGGRVTIFESSSVPANDLSELAVRIEFPQPSGSTGFREPYTFTEAETMLSK